MSTAPQAIEAPAASPAAAELREVSLLGPAWALARRELVRFFRQKGRVIGAVGTPVFIWAFLGLGFGRSFQLQDTAGGEHYLAYFYPGMIAMLVLFTAIFSAISVIQDRNEGFLQSVLVAPVSRVSIVLGKVAGGTAIATCQGAAVLLLAPLAGITLTPASFAASLGLIVVMAFSLSALGFYFAWGTDSVQSFHSVMNLVLFPLWLLSGAFFPPEGWLGVVMHLNPLTYSLAALRHALYLGAEQAALPGLPSLGVGAAVSLSFGAVMLVLGAQRVSRAEG